ncbi:uncharacterized protein TNCV_4260501 [Trichonephila clavipes]|nr:uncharacterized protein TNCV_4260501 [Trichonephila clavipes]
MLAWSRNFLREVPTLMSSSRLKNTSPSPIALASNSVAQQLIRARAHCAHPRKRDHWALRCMNRCPDQVVSLKRDPQCLSPQASLVLIYRPTAVGMKATGPRNYESMSRDDDPRDGIATPNNGNKALPHQLEDV